MLYVMEVACVVLSGGNIVKYDIEERPECSKLIKTLYRRSIEHEGPNLYYWCYLKRVKKKRKCTCKNKNPSTLSRDLEQKICCNCRFHNNNC